MLSKSQEVEEGFLHVRGGVSIRKDFLAVPTEFSPRAWRCFQTWKHGFVQLKVFSTCVEVFPSDCTVPPIYAGFLHVRGGVSQVPLTAKLSEAFSPRAWRCFCC